MLNQFITYIFHSYSCCFCYIDKFCYRYFLIRSVCFQCKIAYAGNKSLCIVDQRVRGVSEFVDPDTTHLKKSQHLMRSIPSLSVSFSSSHPEFSFTHLPQANQTALVKHHGSRLQTSAVSVIRKEKGANALVFTFASNFCLACLITLLH